MHDDLSTIRAELKDYLETEFEVRGKYRDRAYELAKLRLNFYEKLALLCAGTTSLIATAAMTLTGKQQHLVNRYALKTCLFLLIMAIVSSVLSHWVTINWMIDANSRDTDIELCCWGLRCPGLSLRTE